MARTLVSELMPEICMVSQDSLPELRSCSYTVLTARQANDVLGKIDELFCIFYAFWASTEAFTKVDVNAEAVFSNALSIWLESIRTPVKISCSNEGAVFFPPKTRYGFTTLDGFNLHVLIRLNDGSEKYVPLTLIQDELMKISETRKDH